MSWAAALGGFGALGGAVAGMEKAKQAQRIEDSDKRLAAETARYSPWTGMTPQAIRYAGGTQLEGALGGAMQGGLAAGALGASMGTGGLSNAASGASQAANPVSNSSFAANGSIPQQAPGGNAWLGIQKLQTANFDQQPNFYQNYAYNKPY